jgi:DNA-damage-inducible protein J
MTFRTSMLHVRVDERLKTEAAERLSNVGLTISDAVRILLTRVAREGALPAGLAVDPDAYDAWFRAKVQEAIADTRPPIQHSEVMKEAQALIDKKRGVRSRSSDRSVPRRG